MKIDFKQLREEQGIKQYEVSEKTGLAIATVSRMEAGLTSPDFETIVSYLDAIGLKIAIVNK